MLENGLLLRYVGNIFSDITSVNLAQQEYTIDNTRGGGVSAPLIIFLGPLTELSSKLHVEAHYFVRHVFTLLIVSLTVSYLSV